MHDFNVGDEVEFLERGRPTGSIGKVHNIGATVLGLKATDTVQVFWYVDHFFADMPIDCIRKVQKEKQL